MSASLRTHLLTVSRGPQLVLDRVDLVAAPGKRVGLVGPNGVGKSTLLRALAGEVPLDSGSIRLDPPTATVGSLPQEPERRGGETAREFLHRRTGVAAADAELTAATDAMAAGEVGADDRYSDALERWLALGAADLDARIGGVWHDLGLDPGVLDRPTTVLSGGEAARAGLASLVLSRYDVYLLDEPTNDLDLDGLARLESWVTGLDAAVVLVSHDRRFLAEVVTDVVEIDEFSHRATTFGGGWAAYVEERETARRHAWERFEEYDAKRAGLASRAQRQREWASQGQAKVRRSGEKDKHIRNFKMDQTEQLAGKAAQTQRAMDRLEVVEKPREPWELHLSIGSPGRSGDEVFRLDGVVVEHGSFRLGPIDLGIGYGERIAIVGDNGSGKTTLVQTLLGRTSLGAGTRWQGPSVVVGEIEQARLQLQAAAGGPEGRSGGGEVGAPVDGTTVETLFMDLSGWDKSETRSLLAKFGLAAEHVGRAVATLSPGERTRAVLALLAARGANCLVLDEPTNHLDLPAIEQLEQALDEFDGTVLLVTHDRALLDHVRLTRTLGMDGGRLVEDRVR